MPTSITTAPWLDVLGADHRRRGRRRRPGCRPARVIAGRSRGARVADGHGAVLRAAAARPSACRRWRCARRTTACAPASGTCVAAQQLEDAGGRGGDEARLVEPEAADVHRVEAVDVLVRIDAVEDAAPRQMGRQRKLHQDAVDRVVGVERVDERQQLALAGGGGQPERAADHAHLLAGAAFAGDVDREAGSSPTSTAASPGRRPPAATARRRRRPPRRGSRPPPPCRRGPSSCAASSRPPPV